MSVINDTSKSKGLEAKITKWLEQQGYPLEMLVAQAFQKAGFEVLQSDFYADVETCEPREIDIVAYMYADYVEDIWIQVSCCIECKSGRGKPWILFRPNTVVGSDLEFETIGYAPPTTNSEFGDELLKKASYQPKIQSLAMFNIKPVGYGVAQVTFQKGTGPDVPYKAVHSAVKAAVAQAIKSDKDTKRQNKRYCHIIFPVIVIDCRLFEGYLNDTGEIVVKEIDSGILVWKNPITPRYPVSIITIFTKSALENLVQGMAEAADVILRRGEVLDMEIDDSDYVAEEDIPF